MRANWLRLQISRRDGEKGLKLWTIITMGQGGRNVETSEAAKRTSAPIRFKILGSSTCSQNTRLGRDAVQSGI